MYKAVEEMHLDAVWTLIYVLIGVEYALEALQHTKIAVAKKPVKSQA